MTTVLMKESSSTTEERYWEVDWNRLLRERDKKKGKGSAQSGGEKGRSL